MRDPLIRIQAARVVRAYRNVVAARRGSLPARQEQRGAELAHELRALERVLETEPAESIEPAATPIGAAEHAA